MGTLVAEPVKILSIEIPKFALGFPKNTQAQDNEGSYLQYFTWNAVPSPNINAYNLFSTKCFTRTLKAEFILLIMFRNAWDSRTTKRPYRIHHI